MVYMVYFAMFESLMFFEEFPTFYLKELLYKCLIKLLGPVGQYYPIKEHCPAGHL